MRLSKFEKRMLGEIGLMFVIFGLIVWLEESGRVKRG
jgi:hypothetical protein